METGNYSDEFRQDAVRAPSSVRPCHIAKPERSGTIVCPP